MARLTGRRQRLGGRHRPAPRVPRRQGRSRRADPGVPAGPGWPLPATRWRLLLARRGRGVAAGRETVLAAAKRTPLAAFGPRAGEDITAELASAQVRLEL